MAGLANTPLQHLAVLESEVAGLTDTDWSTCSPSELVETGAVLARLVTRAQAAQVVNAEQLQATDAAAAEGWASVKDFLTHLAGGRKGHGGGLLRLAEQTRDLPAVRTAMLAGEISTAQARVIAARTATLPRVESLRHDAAAAMLAQVSQQQLDATDLDRAFGDVVAQLDPDGRLLADDRSRAKQERGAHVARYLALTPDEVGGVVIRGYATVEDAETIRTTLLPLTKPATTAPGACGGDPALAGVLNRDSDGRRLHPGCPAPACSHNGRDPRDHGARLLDALVEVCHQAQTTTALPTTHGATPRITVTIDHRALVAQVESDGLLGSGQSLSAAAVRRLACDADLLPAVLGGEGQVLDVGRTRRLVTTPIWQALVLRDRHCTFPGCSRPPVACDAHHLRHWVDGGETSLDNLTLLCRRHHTITHQSPWTVRLDPTTRRPVWRPPPDVDDRDRFTRFVSPPLRAAALA
ncbi:HNH endonuclease signature motif containing protein [Nocardioides marinquilinus]|uniref:HNH endonuclease signature motif containing protein n=1 Tax=Nocardioides marinquilinus TaxID=1210400 RepID=A0ABP9PQW0_9ACTN